jgi:SAM-dependent methyltransferase
VLKHEALWLRRQLDKVRPVELSPLLSIGSGTAQTRARQWWIDQYVFEPLASRGVEVVHHEHVAGEGVDIAGDLTDRTVWDQLAAVGARAVLCANVLEHVADRHAVADALARTTPPGGRLLVTVPRRYPFHPDPIDTMYRPTVDELAELFPQLHLVAGDEVACWSLASYAWAVRGKRTMVVNGMRSLAHGRRREERDQPSAGVRQLVPFVFGSTSVTGAAFARPESG